MTVTADLAAVEAALQTAIADAAADDQTAAASASKIAELTAEVAHLQDELNNVTPPVPPKPVVTEFAGFRANGGLWGQALPAVVKGAGRDVDVRRLTACTSQYTPATVPLSDASPKTNKLFVARGGGADSAHKLAGVHWADFTVEAGGQGHEFNGLGLYYTTGAVVERVRSRSCAVGSAASPPGETFDDNFTQCDGLTLNDVEYIGGTSSASVCGINSSNGGTVNGGRFAGAVVGMGITLWNCRGVWTFNAPDMSGNHKPANMENCGGAEVHWNRPDWRRKKHNAHLTVNGNNGSARVIIVDPIVDSFPVRVWTDDTPGAVYQGKPQTQNPHDVTLMIDGIDRSGDPAYLVRGHAA